MDVYDELLKAACRMENHESDLYVLSTPTAQRIIAEFQGHLFDETGSFVKKFWSPIDRQLWIEIPFAFSPWWRQRIPKP